MQYRRNAGARDDDEMLLALPNRERAQPRWQRLAGLLISAAQAEDAGLIAAAAARIDAVLGEPPFVAERIAATAKKPPEPSVKRPRQAGKRRA
jgi:hypothetical protein